jgi:hypothetical protein
MEKHWYGMNVFIELKITDYHTRTGMESSGAPEKGYTPTNLGLRYNRTNEGPISLSGRCRNLREMDIWREENLNGEKYSKKIKCVHYYVKEIAAYKEYEL